ncbi:MAG: glucan biosynthesis protein [Beijerinckiaceae bacterium]|nr:glucan biosynthesis protein [Beijerinckiaceae bacterium]
MFKRRDVLKFALAGLSGPAIASTSSGPALAQQTPPENGAGTAAPPAKPARFDPALVMDLARNLARQPWRKPSADLPEPFNALNHEQYVGIQRRPETIIWRDQSIGFALEPSQRGFIFSNSLQINIVEDGVARRLVYDPADYTFGKLNAPADRKDIGFSGFKLWQRAQDGSLEEFCLFQGQGYFQTVGRGQPFGASTRALAVRPVDQGRGEEFPQFVAVWIERPVLAANTVIIHALLDSESVTGAFRYTMRPGDATIVDTECTLFTRAAIDNVGIAAVQGTFLFGPIDRRRGDDVRPGVYDVSGVQMHSGKDEWIWRPVANRQSIQLSAFVDDNPKGFGILQRDRDFAQFADDDNHWEARPSVWTEPLGDWGAGHVTLLEIPAESQVNQNIIVYWRPRATLAANSETTFSYRQWWCWTPADRPPFATVLRSRSGRVTGSPPNARRRRFLVEFRGDALADVARFPEIAARVTTASGSIMTSRLMLSRQEKSARVTFDVDAGAEPHTELRLLLESAGKPISETWLYRWTP